MGHGILSVSLEVLQGALLIPEDHKVVSAHYDPHSRTFQLLVASDKLPEVAEGYATPIVLLVHTVECHVCADGSVNPEYRKITGKIVEPKPLTGL